MEITKMRADLGTQARERIDPELVNEYAAAMTRGDKFP
jgi:hypothetical protein